MKIKNVKVVEASCIGCGACEYKVPEVFKMSDEGYAVADINAVTEENEEKVVEAMEECPTAAIVIEE